MEYTRIRQKIDFFFTAHSLVVKYVEKTKMKINEI